MWGDVLSLERQGLRRLTTMWVVDESALGEVVGA
jgi:hypothetical protein